MLRVHDDSVWRQPRVLFFGAALLFLTNIYFVSDISLTTVRVTSWQVLIRQYAGNLGWITLSLIGLAFLAAAVFAIVQLRRQPVVTTKSGASLVTAGRFEYYPLCIEGGSK